ncbi:unnamed protein product, partial [Ectocarpus fasciculatus]
NPPHTPILSGDFGERVLVDLKDLGVMGYMIVAICHWSNYCWLGHLDSKHADGVAVFLTEVFEEIREIRESWKTARMDAAKSSTGGQSRPVNKSALDSPPAEDVTQVYVADTRDN